MCVQKKKSTIGKIAFIFSFFGKPILSIGREFDEMSKKDVIGENGLGAKK